MDPVTGAVIIVGLQKVGAPAAGVVKDFLVRIFAPTGDVLGQVLAHPIVAWQRRRVGRSELVTVTVSNTTSIPARKAGVAAST